MNIVTNLCRMQRQNVFLSKVEQTEAVRILNLTNLNFWQIILIHKESFTFKSWTRWNNSDLQRDKWNWQM